MLRDLHDQCVFQFHLDANSANGLVPFPMAEVPGLCRGLLGEFFSPFHGQLVCTVRLAGEQLVRSKYWTESSP